MDQHSLARPDSGDTEQHVVGGEIVDREGSGFLEAHRIRNRQHLLRRHAHHIRVSPETRHGQHPLARREALDALAERVDHSGHLIADHARRLGSIGIQPLRGHHLREVQAGRADTDADLARARLGIGRIPYLQRLGSSRPRDPDCSHSHILRSRPGIRVSPCRPTPHHSNPPRQAPMI